jgi:hypothetical protein
VWRNLSKSKEKSTYSREALLNETETVVEKVSCSKCPKFMLEPDVFQCVWTLLSAVHLKYRSVRLKSYHNMTQEVALASPYNTPQLMHWICLAKAVLQVQLQCRLLRFGPHCNKMDLREIGWGDMNSIYLAQDRGQYWASVET